MFQNRRRADRAILRTRRFAMKTGTRGIDIVKNPEKVLSLALHPAPSALSVPRQARDTLSKSKGAVKK